MILRSLFFLGLFILSFRLEARNISFDSIPSDATVSNVEVSNGSLQLTKDSSNNYNEEGYIEIPVSASDISGKLIKLSATRINSLVDGDFSDTALNTIYVYNPASTCGSCASITKSKMPGYWFSSANSMTMPTIFNESTSSDPDYAAKLKQESTTICRATSLLEQK